MTRLQTPTVICIVIIVHLATALAGSIQQDFNRDKRQSYGITRADLHKSIKRLENKLTRHEYREAQLGEFSMKALNALNSVNKSTKKDIQILSQQLAKMEERLFSIESLIQTTDERQRHMLKGLGEGINLLISRSNLNDLPALPQLEAPVPTEAINKNIQTVIKTVKDIEEAVRNDIKKLNNEVKIVGESLNQHMDQLRSRHDQLWTSVNTCEREHIKSLSDVAGTLTKTEKSFSKHIGEATKLLTTAGSGKECKKLSASVTKSFEKLFVEQKKSQQIMSTARSATKKALDEQKKDLELLLEEEREERALVESSFESVFGNLKGLDDTYSSELGRLETIIRDIVTKSSEKITNGVNSVASTLKLKTTNIIDALDDSVSQRSNMQEKIRDSFADLTHDIRGLKKVEQVMISTADAVLDTKRSIEFGIKQVIIELSDIVRHSGSTINSTLSDKINDISFAILKNQTFALTNMTLKMEREISQVWRQIGVMYQQVTQSANVLDDLHSTTSQQMNASLNQVTHMDGTVGKINSKVAGVEDDLNYLLGRLSLVVSEFSQMKSGVGDELDRLRDMAEDFSGGDIVEYKVQPAQNTN